LFERINLYAMDSAIGFPNILIYSLKCDLPVDGRISNLFPNFLGFTRYNFTASDLVVVNCDKHTSFIGQECSVEPIFKKAVPQAS